MKNTMIQQFEGNSIRVAGTTEAPLFVAADVCAVLGLSNPTVALESLDDDEKAKLNLGLPGGATNCVTESGLYHMIFKSRKESAKRFRRWVTDEVLPSIRRDGFYLPTAPVFEDIADRADKVTGKILELVDALIKRGVPPTSASGCASNAFRDAVRIPSPQPTTPSLTHA